MPGRRSQTGHLQELPARRQQTGRQAEPGQPGRHQNQAEGQPVPEHQTRRRPECHKPVQAHLAWPWFAGMQPAAGVVFALDGVLIGAGDVRYLRTLTVSAGLLGFLPATLVAYAADLGLGGVWAGLTLFVLIRLAGMLVRTRYGNWAVTGADLAHPSRRS